MTALGQLIQDTIFAHNVDTLAALPEWEFIVVMGDGFFSDACSGTEYKGGYYSENVIYAAYFARNPNAEPLI